MKKLLSTILASSLTLSLFSTVAMASNFSDTENHWANSYVTDAADLGLVSGYEDGSFKPDQAMKVGEFLVMLTQSYPELVEFSQESGATEFISGNWMSSYAYAADKAGLFPVGMNPTAEDMSADITREQAAYFVFQAMTTIGDESQTVPAQPFNTGIIKDYASIAAEKQEAVVEMYLKGVMSGYNSGDFGPQNQLTRAELCVVMLALNEPDRRSPYKAPDTTGTNSNPDYPDAVFNENGNQIITEGTVSKRPQAQAGDIYILADGTQITLEVGPSGVLGEGQGVSADLGLRWPSGGTVTVGGSGNSDQALNSLGNYIGTAKYWQNQITGEAHWSNEWSVFDNDPTNEGAFVGELSEDYNWYWSGSNWISVVSQTFSAEQLALLKADNGLT